MKFYRAIHYVHASLDGEKTLCGYVITPNIHINVWLWTEVDSLNATSENASLKPCPQCKKHPAMFRHYENTGQQLTLIQENRKNEKS